MRHSHPILRQNALTALPRCGASWLINLEMTVAKWLGVEFTIAPAVVFDTNAYESLSDPALAAMQPLELKSGINAYASYWVIIELLAHIASTSDPAHGRSVAALKRLWRHCSKLVDGRETLMFLADSQNQICKALFDMKIPGRETEPPAYAAIVGTVAHSASPADWSQYQPALDYLKCHVAKIEDQFVQDVWQHVVLGVDPNAGSWRPGS